MNLKRAYTSGASYAVYSLIPEDKVVLRPSPVINMKAKKNKERNYIMVLVTSQFMNVPKKRKIGEILRDFIPPF